MTDPEIADVTYIEPLNEYALTEIIKRNALMLCYLTLEDKRTKSFFCSGP